MSVFGIRLRSARESLGWTQEEVGLAIGIDKLSSRARISRYETGRSEPAFQISQRLAKTLNVPLGYFYCDDDLQAELLLILHRMPVEQFHRVVEVMRSYPLQKIVVKPLAGRGGV